MSIRTLKGTMGLDLIGPMVNEGGGVRDLNITPKHHSRWGGSARGANKVGCGLTFIVPEQDMAWLRGSFVGQTYNLESTTCIQDNLHRDGIFPMIIIPLGGKLVLLIQAGDSSLGKVLEDSKSSLDKCSVDIRPWEPGIVSKERLVWLNIVGVPTHAWNEQFFKQLVQLIGGYGAMD